MAAGLNTQGKLQITELDFDDIKSNLKIFLKSQSQFTDFDFEASGMSILLDTLAYNTHYQAFQANMLANEMFLDTAVKRNSVTSHAKALGYTPTSVKAPTAYVKVTVNDANTATILMPEGFVFTTTIDGVSYQFVNTTDRTLVPTAGIYTFGETIGIPIYEGTWTTTRYTVDIDDPDQRFLISNANVDTSTLQVQVQKSSADTTKTTYTLADNLVNITGTSTSYFIQETTDGEWEIYFGDGVVGKALGDGNIVIIKYIVTNVTDANGASAFTPAAAISGFTNITVVTETAAAGGAISESIDGIKHGATFNYTTQNRAVTAADYKAILPTLYPDIESCAVWGGEYADPPVYGKVYISIRPNTGTNLTNTTKESIKTQLKNNYTVASITPEFIDPVTTKIIPVVNFKFNATITNKTATDLETSISTAIGTFSDDNLEAFESIFRYSKFIRTIDDVDTSILSNITTITITQELTPTLSTTAKYTIDFNNPLHNPHSGHMSILSSTGFTISGNANTLYLDDDGAGNVRTYYLVGATKTYVDESVGTISYTTGQIVLNSFNITAVSNTSDTITLTVKPSSNDLVPVRNQLFEIDTSNMTVAGEADTLSSGASNAGTTYVTKPSY